MSEKTDLTDWDNKPSLLWEKSWIKEWHTLEDCDKKVLAALYWEDLSQNQKDEFASSDYIELMRLQDAKKTELVNNPTKMRQHFLEKASPLIDQMIDAALGNKKMLSTNDYAINQVWSVLQEMIRGANNPAPLLDLKGKPIENQIDQILTKVSDGEITFEEAKEYMSLVSTGFNLQKLPELLLKLEQLESS
jgi:hypothetical protein